MKAKRQLARRFPVFLTNRLDVPFSLLNLGTPFDSKENEGGKGPWSGISFGENRIFDQSIDILCPVT